jgi:hypothetical protein
MGPNANRMYIMNAESEQARIDWLSALVAAGARTADQSAASKARSPQQQRGSIIATNQLVSAAAASVDKRMFTASSHEGYMLKLGGLQKNYFQQRYFVVLHNHLLYFREPNFDDDHYEVPRGTIHLAGAVVALEPPTTARQLYDHEFVFTITPLHQPKSSVFTSLFGEVTRKYVFVCRDAADLAGWVAAVQARVDRAASQADDASDSDDDGDLPASFVASTSNTPASNNVLLGQTDLTASLSSLDHFASAGTGGAGLGSSRGIGAGPSAGFGSSFTPPSADLLCHLYFADQPVGIIVSAEQLSWKRRFCGLSLPNSQLIVWKHKPSMRNGGNSGSNKPTRINLAGATVRVSKQLSCSKTAGVPVMTVTLEVPRNGGASTIHLAANSQARVDQWLSFLKIAAAPDREDARGGAAGAAGTSSSGTSSGKFTSPQPNRRSVASASDHLAPSSASQDKGGNGGSRSNSRRSSRQSDAAADAAAAAAVSTNASSSGSTAGAAAPKSSAVLLAAMSEALNDADAMASFRARSVELHKGTVSSAQYFRAYFRTFGKELGLRFWNDLLAIVPRAELAAELAQLYEQHKHLFGESADDAVSGSGAQSAAAVSSTAAAASALSAAARNGGNDSSNGRAAPRPTRPVRGSSNGAVPDTNAATADSFGSSEDSDDDENFDDGERQRRSHHLPSFGFAPPPMPASAPPAASGETPAAVRSGGSGGISQPSPSSNIAAAFAFFGGTSRTPLVSPSHATSAAAAASPATAASAASTARRGSYSSSSTDWSAVSPRPAARSASAAPTPVASPTPTTPGPAPSSSSSSASVSSSASSVPMPAAIPGESDGDLRDRVAKSVHAWGVRGEHHILTLLCSLHEILPGVVAVGAFIPFQETAPSLREVQSTYLKAMRVLHPDKTKLHPHHIQVLCASVFQCVTTAWEQYEKKERKRLRKQEAAAAAAADRT